MKLIWVYMPLLLLTGCATVSGEHILIEHVALSDTIAPYVPPITQTKGFDAIKAVNRAADIENIWYNEQQKGVSRYAGTEWLKMARISPYNDEHTFFDQYQNCLEDSVGICPMHCTHYAMEALKAGMSNEDFARLDSLHERIWKKREYAGWSVAYILVKYFDWKAVAMLYPDSEEFTTVSNSFKNKQTYPVWRQPDIPLEELFILPKQQQEIDSLLQLQTFGWGFSYQGWHTWFTRYNELLECNWWGSPAQQFNETNTSPLFLRRKFIDFHDYDSHVICFPPTN
ncbi:MAG: hypothetical protein AB8F95_00115 [Bacteroidia bacterium]